MGQPVLKDDPQLFVRIQLQSFQETIGGAKFVSHAKLPLNVDDFT